LDFTANALNIDIPALERLKPLKLGFWEKLVSWFLHKGFLSYGVSYFIYFLTQSGVSNKLQFIGRTIIPSRYTMAHSLSLPLSEIKFFHYCQRIEKIFLNF
jgi:hypothetical protein